jgi:hypothetical protein
MASCAGLPTRSCGQRCKQNIVRPGPTWSNPAMTTCVCQRNRKCPSLAETARSPRQAAAAAAAASAATTAASPAASSAAATATSAAPAAAASACKFLAVELACSGGFLVEDVERRQADVGDLFLTERDDLRCRILRRHIRYRSGGRCGCSAARHRQGHPGDSQHRHGFTPTLSLRGALCLRHGRILHSKKLS